jgi:hypothetical protein
MKWIILALVLLAVTICVLLYVFSNRIWLWLDKANTERHDHSEVTFEE